MGMTVKRRKDSNVPHVMIHKIADVRGGVSVKTADLPSDVDFLPEGTFLERPDGGICSVKKYAMLYEETQVTATSVKIEKGSLLNVGDIIAGDGINDNVKVVAITRDGSYDTITTDKKIGSEASGKIGVGTYIYRGGVSNGNAYAVTGTGMPICKGDNINVDAWLIGVMRCENQSKKVFIEKNIAPKGIVII